MRAALIAALVITLRAVPLAAGEASAAGFDHFYNLEYDQALADFNSDTQAHAGDLNAWNHLAQCILYREMYHNGALETELFGGTNPFFRRQKLRMTAEDERQFTDAINRAIERSQAMLTENAKDTQGLYALGVAYGLRANYSFLFRKAWLDSLRDATNARRVHKKLIEIDPNNVDAHLIPGVHDYVVGSLSWHYRLLGLLAGFHGDKALGISTLQSVAAHGKVNDVDAEVILTAIYRREKRSQEAIPLMQDLIRRFPRNPLMRFELAHIYGDTGNKQRALAEIATIRELKQRGSPGFQALREEKIDYVTGTVLFWDDDLDGALENMQKATAHSADLDPNTRLMSWMRLGQIHDLRGERPQAVAAYKEAIDCAPDSDVAKECRGYISARYRRKS